jgi:hypothetical protein
MNNRSRTQNTDVNVLKIFLPEMLLHEIFVLIAFFWFKVNKW